MHWDEDISKKKVQSLREKLDRMNPHITIETKDAKLDEDNVDGILNGIDLIIDATDNMIVRRTINNACVKYNIPFIHAGMHGFYGQVMIVVPGVTPCLSCVFDETNQEPKGWPVLISLVSILASTQALEAIKMLGEIGEPTLGYLIHVDGLLMSVEKIKVKRNPTCNTCKNVKLPEKYESKTIKGA